MGNLTTVVFKRRKGIALYVIIAVPVFVILWSDRLMVEKNGLGFNIASERTILTSDPSSVLEDLASYVTGTERPKITDQLCNTYTFLRASNSILLRGRLLNNRSIYYCNIPKCGSTFMSMFLSPVFECTEKCEESVEKYEELSAKRHLKKTQELLDDAYSFMFVREPYARLFSAYENKLFLPNQFWTTLGVQVIRSVRAGASSENLTIGHDVTFLELVVYVLQLHEQGIELNKHLAPMIELCNPCQLKFNFIGKLETMSKDLVNLVHDWKVKDIIAKNKTAVATLETDTLYKRAFGPFGHMFSVTRTFGRKLSRFKLFQRAWSSYHIRGLILKKYEMPFNESEVANIDKRRYETEIKKAIDSSSLHKGALKIQREEALIQAYRSVPMDILMKLKNFMKPDCLLFGYDNMPPKLFNINSVSVSINHNYFKGL